MVPAGGLDSVVIYRDPARGSLGANRDITPFALGIPLALSLASHRRDQTALPAVSLHPHTSR